MSRTPIYTEVAESILEHAAAIARLDAKALGVDEYDKAYAVRVQAIRLIAVSYVDPQPDRELVRQLRTLSGDVPGVFVHLVDGAVELIVDSASRQHKLKLWTRAQLMKNEEDETDHD